jgi:hypothetical protein
MSVNIGALALAAGATEPAVLFCDVYSVIPYLTLIIDNIPVNDDVVLKMAVKSTLKKSF